MSLHNRMLTGYSGTPARPRAPLPRWRHAPGPPKMPQMNVFRRRLPPIEPPIEPARPTFGEWLLRQFTAGHASSDMPFSRLERICSNAALLLCGAVFARPEHFLNPAAESGPLAREGSVIARRTADGFKASLADRKNTVMAWPWDHMATSVAWTATRTGDLSEEAIGRALTDLGVAYSLSQRDQLAAVIDLWTQVTAGLNAQSPPPDIQAMACDMLTAYQAAAGAGERS